MMACCLVLTYRHRKFFRIREKETRAGWPAPGGFSAPGQVHETCVHACTELTI